MIKNIKEVKECPDCGSDNIVYNEERSQVICRDCGLIFEPLTPKEEEKYEEVAGIKNDKKQPPKKKAPQKKKGAKKRKK